MVYWNTNFTRTVFEMILSEPSCLALVQYLGDQSPYAPKTHGNAKEKQTVTVPLLQHPQRSLREAG